MATSSRSAKQHDVRPGDPFSGDPLPGDRSAGEYRDIPGREARTALSALNLRTVLAVFGLIVCGFFAWWSTAIGAPVAAGILAFLALTAVIDLIVIARRKRQRAAGQPGRTHYSLFE
jgi:hypothetical protein